MVQIYTQWSQQYGLTNPREGDACSAKYAFRFSGGIPSGFSDVSCDTCQPNPYAPCSVPLAHPTLDEIQCPSSSYAGWDGDPTHAAICIPYDVQEGIVGVNISVTGNGYVLSSGGDNTLAERSYIDLPTGYKAYFQAVADAGSNFVKWRYADGIESTQNPIEFEITKSGSITAYFSEGGAIPDLPDTDPCPKGSSYVASTLTAVTRDCGSGYTAVGGLANTKCICDALTAEEKFAESPPEVQEYYGTSEGQTFGYNLGSIMAALPMIIGALILIQLIGAFRK